MTADAILYEVTLEDSKAFTRPWKMSMPLYRRLDANARLMEFKCVEMTEESQVGYLRREPLVRRWEGRTTIVEITPKTVPASVGYEEYHWSGTPPPPDNR